MLINSERNLVELQNVVQTELGTFFSKKSLKVLCKVIMGKGKVDIVVVKGDRIKNCDGLYIKEINTYLTDGSEEEIDIEYEVLEGNVIPGLIRQNINVKDGKLVHRAGFMTTALFSKSNILIFKEKLIRKKKCTVNRNLVYALIFDGRAC